MVAFVTLCEDYMGIEPHFNLWNYFFCAQLQQGLSTEMAALGNVDIFFISGCGVDPYFHFLTLGPSDGWQKLWFFLSNDTDTPLPVFTGSHPVPQPNWGYGVAQRDLCMIQPLCEVIQQLLRGGLMGTDLLRTLLSHHVELLHL
jgi:hypothetical protein